MSKEYLLKFAQGRENEPEDPPCINCIYDFDVQTQEIKIYCCDIVVNGSANFLVCHSDTSGSRPTDEELNKEINEYLGNETPVMYVNSKRKSTLNYPTSFDIGIIKNESVKSTFAHSEDEVDTERDFRYYQKSSVEQ